MNVLPPSPPIFVTWRLIWKLGGVPFPDTIVKLFFLWGMDSQYNALKTDFGVNIQKYFSMSTLDIEEAATNFVNVNKSILGETIAGGSSAATPGSRPASGGTSTPAPGVTPPMPPFLLTLIHGNPTSLNLSNNAPCALLVTVSPASLRLVRIPNARDTPLHGLIPITIVVPAIVVVPAVVAVMVATA